MFSNTLKIFQFYALTPQQAPNMTPFSPYLSSSYRKEPLKFYEVASTKLMTEFEADIEIHLNSSTVKLSKVVDQSGFLPQI